MFDFKRQDPEFAERFEHFAFDEVVNEPGQQLDDVTRHLAILATLLGCQGIDAFREELPAALDGGVTPVMAKEVIYQAVDYLGMGRVLPFLQAANEILAARGVSLPLEGQATTTLEDRLEKGAQAQAEIQRQAARHAIDEPQNLEEQALKLVGDDIYQKLIKGYTEKQWGRDCKELPPFILKRVPLRFTFDNNYFTDPHQGIPLEGYAALVERLLTGSDVLLSTPYEEFIAAHPDAAWKTVYTGTIDGFFHYCYGPLEYRSLRFETQVRDCPNYQGSAVVNYTAREVPYTRVIEHKHFQFGAQEKTVLTWEYPSPWQPGEEPYYPVNDEKNQALLARYQELARSRPEVLFGGRLGSYRYYNMDQVLRAALDAAAQELA